MLGVVAVVEAMTSASPGWKPPEVSSDQRCAQRVFVGVDEQVDITIGKSEIVCTPKQGPRQGCMVQCLERLQDRWVYLTSLRHGSLRHSFHLAGPESVDCAWMRPLRLRVVERAHSRAVLRRT